MKWISIPRQCLDVKWQEEGWFFDQPAEDYQTKLRCKKCGQEQRVNMCKKEMEEGWNHDSICAPVYCLRCTKCNKILAQIDEQEREHSPLLNLLKDACEFVHPLSG